MGSNTKNGETKKMSTNTKKSGASKPELRNPLLLANGQTLADPKAMRAALRTLDVAVSGKATPEEMVDALRATLAPKLKKLNPKEHMVCDDCGEASTDETDACPFCGSEGDASEEGAAVSEPEKAKPAGKGAAIAKTTDASLAEKGKELDEVISRIEVLKKNLGSNSYDLGVELKRLQVGDLWKARKKGDGQTYASFKDFLETEVSISRGTAYRLMDLTENYDRATFDKVGPSKLALIAGIEDEEKRAELLADARSGASKRTIERKAGKGPSATKPAATAAPAKKSPNDITLLTKVGSKAELHPFRSVETKRAVKAYDPEKDLYCEVQISEEVVLQIAPKKEKDGTIVGLTTRFVRVAE